jgi:ATP-dependent Lhr-like helicase
VLAQQLVAMTSMERWPVDDLYATVDRRAVRGAVAADLRGVLDMLSGRYPSDEFAELRRAVTVGSQSTAV